MSKDSLYCWSHWKSTHQHSTMQIYWTKPDEKESAVYMFYSGLILIWRELGFLKYHERLYLQELPYQIKSIHQASARWAATSISRLMRQRDRNQEETWLQRKESTSQNRQTRVLTISQWSMQRGLHQRCETLVIIRNHRLEMRRHLRLNLFDKRSKRPWHHEVIYVLRMRWDEVHSFSRSSRWGTRLWLVVEQKWRSSPRVALPSRHDVLIQRCVMSSCLRSDIPGLYFSCWRLQLRLQSPHCPWTRDAMIAFTNIFGESW